MNPPPLPIPFWGVEGHFPDWFPERDFYLVSAASLWWPSRQKFVRRSYPSPRTRMFLDSGGFSFFSRSGDYPFSPDDYLRLVEHPYYGYQPLIWASLDYPCEPETVRTSQLNSNRDRIDATIDHLDYFTRKATWPGMIAVIQGYTIDEYAYCLEEMARRQLSTKLMGVGSMCARTSATDIDRTIAEVARLVCEIIPHSVKLHLFGVKINVLSLKRGIGWPHIFSFDTAAWGLGRAGESRNPSGKKEKSRRFFRYRKKVRRLLEKPKQIPLPQP